MPVLLVAMMQGLLNYVVFANIRRVSYGIKELLPVFLLIAITDVLLSSISIGLMPYGIIANMIFVIIMTFVDYSKTKILPLSIVYATFTCILILLSGMLSNVVFDSLYVLVPGFIRFSRDAITGDIGIGIMYIAVLAMISITISHKVGVVFQERMRALDFKLQQKLSIYLLIGATITLGLFFVAVFIHEILYEEAMLTLVYAFSFTAIFAFLVFAIFAFTDNIRNEMDLNHQKELLENLQSYTQHIEDMTTRMRMFRHDHINLLLTFQAHIQQRDWDGLRKIYNLYNDEFLRNADGFDSCMDRLSRIQTPELKTLIFFKCLEAQKLGVDIIIEVVDDITVIGIHNLLDTCRIVGILMDNALEACVGVEGAVVRFMGAMSGDCARFVIQNTCRNLPPINKISEKGYTTKEGSRGMGLYIVSQLQEKNGDLFLQTKISDGYFTQELALHHQ